MPKAERALIITTLNQVHHKLKCTLTPAMWELYSHQVCQWNDNSTNLEQHQVTALSPTCCCRWLKCHWVCKDQWSHSLHHHYSCYKFILILCWLGSTFPVFNSSLITFTLFTSSTLFTFKHSALPLPCISFPTLHFPTLHSCILHDHIWSYFHISCSCSPLPHSHHHPSLPSLPCPNFFPHSLW